jgi:hypothetical protein
MLADAGAVGGLSMPPTIGTQWRSTWFVGQWFPQYSRQDLVFQDHSLCTRVFQDGEIKFQKIFHDTQVDYRADDRSVLDDEVVDSC